MEITEFNKNIMLSDSYRFQWVEVVLGFDMHPYICSSDRIKESCYRSDEV